MSGPRPFSGIVETSRHRPTESPGHHPARHEHLSLAYCLEGELRLEQDGDWTVAPGDVLLVPAGTAHRWQGASAGARLWGLRMCATCLVGLDAATALEPFERVRAGAAAVVQLPAARRPFFESLLGEIEQENARPEPSARRLAGLTTLVLDEVARAASWSAVAAGEGTLVSETLAFIERHCLEPIGLREVALAMHRSPSHLTTIVRRTTGKTVQRWILAGRLAEAERRLLHTDERIDVLAERVGYRDATHFIRMFRRERGITPAAFRAQRLRLVAPQP